MTILGEASPATLPRHGCKPSDQAKLDASPKAHEHPPVGAYISGAKPLPRATNNAAKLVARKNQGASEACTAHSLSALLSTVCVLAGVPCVEPSEHVLYTRSGRKEVGPHGELQDDGRQMLDVWAAAQEDGLVTQGPNPDGRNSDVWTAEDLAAANLDGPSPNVCAEIPADVLAQAKKCRPPVKLVTVDPAAADVELQVKASLAAGHLVWNGNTVGQAYQDLRSGEIAQPTPADDHTAVGHAQFFIDYRTLDDGSCEYLEVNSWGDEWGTDGMTWSSPAYLRACFELHAIGVDTSSPETLGEKLADDLRAVELAVLKAVA